MSKDKSKTPGVFTWTLDIEHWTLDIPVLVAAEGRDRFIGGSTLLPLFMFPVVIVGAVAGLEKVEG
jgi:hypothetical protein